MSVKRPVHNHLYFCLGQAINKRRKSLKMSQAELSQESGIDRSFISALEQGKRDPSFGTLASLVQGLKMRYSRLLHSCETCVKHLKEVEQA